MRKVFILPALIAAAVAVGACGVGPDKSREDAHDATGQYVDKNAPHVIAFNNHYPNVETKCDGFGHRIFATTDEHGNGVMIYPDPTCPGYVKGQEPLLVLPTK